MWLHTNEIHSTVMSVILFTDCVHKIVPMLCFKIASASLSLCQQYSFTAS